MTVLPYRTLIHSTKKSINSGILFDGICFAVLLMGVCVHVAFFEPGMLYFGMKDVTAEFLKITLVYVALDVADKVRPTSSHPMSLPGSQILCNVGVDVMAMLMESCELYCTGRTGLMSLLLDAWLFLIVTWVHSFVVMSSAMVWYVSMESERAILTFMIISNFGEIKTTVFKRFDTKKLFVLCRMDVVERVNLFIAVLFIIIEDLGQLGQWTLNKDILIKCALILLLESIVDITKHSVVVNFNGTRPGIYREYLKDLFQNLQQFQGEGTIKKLMLEPIGPAVLLLRVFLSALAIGGISVRLKAVIAVLFISVLFFLKLLLGWFLQVSAVWYLQYFDAHYGNSDLLETKQR